MHPLIAHLKGKLIVSVQAYPGEPMRHPETMAQIARAAEIGGAAAIRCQGLSDISAIKGRVDVPVIGLWKEGHEGVYITPSLRHARACVMAGSDIVALDATAARASMASPRLWRPCVRTAPSSWPTAAPSRTPSAPSTLEWTSCPRPWPDTRATASRLTDPTWNCCARSSLRSRTSP